MKRYILYLALTLLSAARAQTGYTICPGESVTLTAVNSASLSNPAYSMNPGGITSSSGTFVANPQVSTVYTLYVTGTNSNSASVTTIDSVFVTVSGFSTFSLVTTPANFTLGCSTKSTAVVMITNVVAVPPGSPLSYTIFGPGGSTIPQGPFGPVTVYTLSSPGTHTAVVNNNIGNCATRLPFSVLNYTFVPQIDSITTTVPHVDCNNPVMGLSAYSNPAGLKLWSSPWGSVAGNSVTASANFTSPTNTIVANYTLTVTDQNNLCKTTTVITVLQNLFKPIAKISITGSLTCTSPTLELVNQSISGIPQGSQFPKSMPVIGLLWQGPVSLANSSTYTAYIPGTYTLTVKDLNNGCSASTTAIVADHRVYPLVNTPVAPPPANLCGNTTATLSPVISSPSVNLSYSWSIVPGATVSGIGGPVLVTNMPGTYVVHVKNAEGCVSSSSMQVIFCVDVPEYDLQQLTVFPNPAGQFIYVSGGAFSGVRSLSVFDAAGRMVLQKDLLRTGENMNLGSLPAGMYLLKLDRENGSVATTRFLKSE